MHCFNRNYLREMKRLVFLVALPMAFFSCEKEGIEQPKLPEEPKSPVELIRVEDCEKCIVLAEQLKNRVAIVDLNSKNIIWEWKAVESNVLTPHLSWFNLPDEAKPVYGGKYILLTASGGGVALVRVKDKKTLFYANAGGNPHSAELLPDGNIVTSSSTGNKLTLFKVDTLAYPDQGYRKTLFIEDGHNVVWDRQRQKLWATSNSTLKAYSYNNNCSQPSLTEVTSIAVPGPGTHPHDLFPVYGEDALWMSTTTNVYKFNVPAESFSLHTTALQSAIKSISSGPQGWPILLMQPKVQYWSDEVKDEFGRRVFQQNDLKIYKARWLVKNNFSYPENHEFRQCD
jgi:hypothetical protein